MILSNRGVACISISLLLFLSPFCLGQRMPREDVIDVPAIAPGFCVSNLFQTNMVVQRDKPIRIWGWANPGDKIRVEFGGNSTTGTANEQRQWVLTLPPQPANRTPQTMTVSCSDQTISLENILVGDVWLLGGQSNMEFELAKVENGNLEIVSANFPEIRILTIPYGQGPESKRGFARLHEWSSWFGRHFRKGDWDICSPDKVREFSAIGYAFARRIHKASDIPIGVIDASRGGTTVETWTPISRLEKLVSQPTQQKLAQFKTDVANWNAQADLEKRIADHAKWLERQIKQGKSIPEDRKAPPSDLRPGPLGNHNYPGHCYAGMIAPLEGLSVKGVIWHQGYNNAFDGSAGVAMYQDILPEMIAAWREAFDDQHLPFGIISLCTDGYPQTIDDYCEKMFNAGIDLRAAQYQVFLDLLNAGDKNIGFASTYDLRRRWYHPQVKIPAGERIARWALATQYGFERQIEWKPPAIVGIQKLGSSLQLEFDRPVGDPQDGDIVGFSIAGDERKFQPATASYAENGKDNRGRIRYDRTKLILSSPLVSKPIHYRYAWGRNPLANLQAMGNKDLPVATQRSDNWSMEEVPLGAVDETAAKNNPRAIRNQILRALRKQDMERRLLEAKMLIESQQEAK